MQRNSEFGIEVNSIEKKLFKAEYRRTFNERNVLANCTRTRFMLAVSFILAVQWPTATEAGVSPVVPPRFIRDLNLSRSLVALVSFTTTPGVTNANYKIRWPPDQPEQDLSKSALELEFNIDVPGRYIKPSVEQLAHVRSEVRILSIDDVEFSEPKWEASLEPGPHSLIVWYPTVVANYRCTFEIEVEAGQSYEIIERSDRFPVFFNRMEEGILFSLLSRRLERFPPLECTKIKGADES